MAGLCYKHRATILSTKALLAQIPYIILVLVFANLTLSSKLNNLFLIYTLLAVLALIYSLVFMNTKQTKQYKS